MCLDKLYEYISISSVEKRFRSEIMLIALIFETSVFCYGRSGKETKYRQVTSRLQIRAPFSSCSSSWFKLTFISQKCEYSSREGLLSKRNHSTENALGIRQTHHPLHTRRIPNLPAFFNCRSQRNVISVSPSWIPGVFASPCSPGRKAPLASLLVEHPSNKDLPSNTRR